MPPSKRKIKCVVWDLDNTVWNGILLEGDRVTVCRDVVDVIQELDGRGILHSIASRNDEALAVEVLKDHGLDKFFLVPQINWGPKSTSVARIADLLNISLDSLAFVDDQEVEREEVRFSCPDVLVLDSSEVTGIVDRPEFRPERVTQDSARRREMYRNSFERLTAEENFVGPKESFLASLGMVFRISMATEADLDRAEELTVRTNQLNTTGVTYSHEDLSEFLRSDDHELIVAELEDRFGSYGTIGLALVYKSPKRWTLKLLLMSCRVMSTGAGGILLRFVRGLAREAGVEFVAEFRPTPRNRMMYATLRFAGFRERSESMEGLVEMWDESGDLPDYPSFVQVKVADGEGESTAP